MHYATKSQLSLRALLLHSYLNPNYAIGLPKLVIVLVLWVFANNLKLTQRLIDDYL